MPIKSTPSSLSSVNEGISFTDVLLIEEDVETVPPTLEDPEPLQPTPGIITSCVVTSSHSDPGISITVGSLPSAQVSVTISGSFTNIFDQKFWQYKNTIDSSVTTTTSTSSIPEVFFALTRYSPDPRRTITVSYTITTNLGNIVLTKDVLNDWNAGLAAFQSMLDRQEVL